MCCDPPAADRLPPQLAAMLEQCRALAAERPTRPPPAGARWLLDWLDRFEVLLDGHGRFADDCRRAELAAVADRARAVYRAIAGPA